MRDRETSRVRATLIQSRRTPATPKAVLTSMGHSEQMKITKMAEVSESLMMNSARGIHASGEIGLSTCMKGSSARYTNGDMPITKPSGTATITRSEEHTSELQSRENLVCRLLLEKKNNTHVT